MLSVDADDVVDCCALAPAEPAAPAALPAALAMPPAGVEKTRGNVPDTGAGVAAPAAPEALPAGLAMAIARWE